MFKKISPSISLFLLSIFLGACSSHSHLSDRYDIKKAHILSNDKLNISFANKNYARFTISSDTPRELFFSTRCAFEEKGFKYVGYSERPDFIVTVNSALPYRLTYIPPKETLYERVNTEGFIVQKHFSSPAFAERFFQPKLQVKIHDFQQQELVWEGEGSGEVKEADKVLSEQILLRQVMASLPEEKIFLSKKPYQEMEVMVLSQDKKNYYPTVVKVPNSSELVEGDEIRQIDGVSLGNLSSSQVYHLIEKKKRREETLAFSFKRKDQLLTARIKSSQPLFQDSPLEYSHEKRYNPLVINLKPYEVLRGQDPFKLPKQLQVLENIHTQPLAISTYEQEQKASEEKSLTFIQNLEQAYNDLELPLELI